MRLFVKNIIFLYFRMNVKDFIKYIELVYSTQKQDLIKKAINDFDLFLEQHKEDFDDEEEEEEEKEFIIYQICSNDETIIEKYIGLTTNLDLRWYHHKRTCENENYKYHNKHLYQFIRQTKGITNWKIIELERKICKRFEARNLEQSYIDNLGATLNKIRAQKI